jgi:predicted amidophosphoribosyltransferase
MIKLSDIRQIAKMLTDDPDIMNEQIRLQNPASLTCTNCGSTTNIGDKACKQCGTPISWTGSAGNYRPGSMVCPNCGAPWEQGEAKCSHCDKPGRPITKVDQTAPTSGRKGTAEQIKKLAGMGHTSINPVSGQVGR